MKTALSVVAIASVGLMAVSSAVHAQDFIVDSPFTVNGTGSPAAASERDRVPALIERSVSGLTMTKGVFALVALCSFAFGFVAVWYFLG